MNFSNFFTGSLKTAQITVSVEGDLGSSYEYAEVYVDGAKIDNICDSGCSDCAGTWQGTSTFDVKNQSLDNNLQILADSTWWVDPSCSWINPNHAMKMKVELSWSEETIGVGNQFKKGVIQPTSSQPIEYPADQEVISLITSYVRNNPPIFGYFDKNGDEITSVPARVSDAKMMKIFLVVNIDPNRPPQEFELESYIQLRNIKEE